MLHGERLRWADSPKKRPSLPSSTDTSRLHPLLNLSDVRTGHAERVQRIPAPSDRPPIGSLAPVRCWATSAEGSFGTKQKGRSSVFERMRSRAKRDTLGTVVESDWEDSASGRSTWVIALGSFPTCRTQRDMHAEALYWQRGAKGRAGARCCASLLHANRPRAFLEAVAYMIPEGWSFSDAEESVERRS